MIDIPNADFQEIWFIYAPERHEWGGVRIAHFRKSVDGAVIAYIQGEIDRRRIGPRIWEDVAPREGWVKVKQIMPPTRAEVDAAVDAKLTRDRPRDHARGFRQAMIVEPEVEVIPQIQLGDMTVIGRWPGKVLKALATVATTLHPAYDLQPDTQRGGSKETCLFSSLAVRDFFYALGCTDATVRGCGVVMRATADGRELHSVGIGVPGQVSRPEKFNGHAVCVVPSLNLLIDTTLYQSIRPAWGGALTGMFAVGMVPPRPVRVYGRHPFSGVDIALSDRRFEMVWIDRPELKWKRSVDYRERSPRRRAVTAALIQRFGEWVA